MQAFNLFHLSIYLFIELPPNKIVIIKDIIIIKEYVGKEIS